MRKTETDVNHIKKDLLKSLVFSVMAIAAIFLISYLKSNPDLLKFI